MEHLDFIKKLDKLGISIRSTNNEDESKLVEINNVLSYDVIEIKNLKCRYVNKHRSNLSALREIVTKAIDIDEWKHSIHNEIEYDNYEKFVEIIQDKILQRAEDIDFLLTVMFILKKQISDIKE